MTFTEIEKKTTEILHVVVFVECYKWENQKTTINNSE